MSLSEITITGETAPYTSYASLAEADRRLAVDPIRMSDWEALADNDKNIHLAAGTNRLDLLEWDGEKTGGASQENAWPRSGLTYADGSEVASDAVPHEIEVATILLAGTISKTPAAGGAGTSASAIKSVQAGSAQVEFFHRQAALDGKPLQDETAFEVVRQWLGGQVSGPVVTGLECESVFQDDDYGYTQGLS